MKKHILAVSTVAALLLVLGLAFPAQSAAGVNVEVTVPLPGLVISSPPVMLVIPGTYVYYPPDVREDIFFYHGHWYRPYRGQWFWATHYNGPWRGIAIEKVPRPVFGIPPHFRQIPPEHERMPYSTVQQNWRPWERERHWDRHEEHREYRRDEEREREEYRH